MRNQRKHVWIDRFQTLLFVRVFFYFIGYQIAAWSIVLLERSGHHAVATILGEEAAAYFLIVPLAIVLFVSVVFAYDAVKLAHRVVGPLYRFRKTIQAITAGGEVDLIKLRDGDLLQDIRDDLNAMLEALDDRGAVTLKGAPGAPAQPTPQGV